MGHVLKAAFPRGQGQGSREGVSSWTESWEPWDPAGSLSHPVTCGGGSLHLSEKRGRCHLPSSQGEMDCSTTSYNVRGHSHHTPPPRGKDSHPVLQMKSSEVPRKVPSHSIKLGTHLGFKSFSEGGSNPWPRGLPGLASPPRFTRQLEGGTNSQGLASADLSSGSVLSCGVESLPLASSVLVYSPGTGCPVCDGVETLPVKILCNAPHSKGSMKTVQTTHHQATARPLGN